MNNKVKRTRKQQQLCPRVACVREASFIQTFLFAGIRVTNCAHTNSFPAEIALSRVCTYMYYTRQGRSSSLHRR